MSCPARLAPVLLASLLGSACSAVTPSSPNPSDGSMPTRRILVNGVRVVVQEFHASDVVAVQLWVGVGARDEASSELGLAHYLEHMLFKGTVTRAPGFVEREVEGVGGRINAGTSLDYTYYHTVLPSPALRPGIFRAGRRRTHHRLGGAGGGGTHTRAATAQRTQAASPVRARRRALGEARDRAARDAGLSRDGVARPKARPCGHAR